MINTKSDFFGYNPDTNLLPYDGQAYYYGPIIDSQIAKNYYEKMLETMPWQHDEVLIYGKRIITARKVAWVGDANYAYTYSGTTKHPTAWTLELLEIKACVEKLTATSFNSCLLNLYHNGQEGMGWHSDDEASLGKNNIIASLSFGAERKFAFRHKKTKEKITLMLEPASLLVMKGSTQENWQHSLLKSAKIDSPRINLTFRTVNF